MSRYRNALPQLDGGLFATDGGLETTLIYHEGLDLPCFAAFMLLRDENGVAALRRYFARYIAIADRYAFTINYVEEGIGIARAARTNGMPVAVCFTVETDGRLPSGQALRPRSFNATRKRMAGPPTAAAQGCGNVPRRGAGREYAAH